MQVRGKGKCRMPACSRCNLLYTGLLLFSLAQLFGHLWGAGNAVCFLKGFGCGLVLAGAAAMLWHRLGRAPGQ